MTSKLWLCIIPHHITSHHITSHHITSHQHYYLNSAGKPPSFRKRLKERLKHYKFIKYPYDIFVRPVRKAFHDVFHLTSVGTRNFCLKHEPLRGIAIQLKGYKSCRLSTVYDYCKEHDGIIRVYDDSCEYPARPLCKTREDFEANNFAEPVMRPAYYIYVSKIRDAVIFGYEDLIFAGDCCLTDRKKQIQGNYYYISRNIPEIKPDTALVKIHKNPEVIERGIDLVKMWSGNYYHFMYEALARLQLVDAMEEYRTWPLIVDEGALRNVWNVQLLEMVNTYNHPVITVQQGEAYLVREMIYPSFLNWGEKNSGYAPRMNTKAAEYIRNKIIDTHKPARTYKNVYMARGDNKRLLNEDSVIKCLEDYGFEIIYPRVDNYEQILDVFMTADNIMGVMGTNIVSQVLSKIQTNIYIISPFEFQHDTPGFSVTDASGLALNFIAAEVNHLGPVLNQTDFTVDIARIEALAQKLSR